MHSRVPMNTHPVQLKVASGSSRRVHVLIRLLVLVALGAVGWSSIYWLVYLAVPAVVALLVTNDRRDYPDEYAPRVMRVLRWLAGAYAYLWLLTDEPPSVEGGPVELTVELHGMPTPGSALARIVTSVPALIVLAVLSMVSAVLWVLGALAILLVERVPAWITDFIAMKLSYQFRLMAYHLSLVDTYPSITDASLTQAPHAT